MSKALQSSLLSSAPMVPHATQWTKSGPALDQLASLYWVHGLLPALMATAFDTPTNKRPRVTTGDDHDFTFLQECDFPHVAGVRFKRAVQFVNSPTTRQRLTVMAVVKEGLRFLTSRFLRCACAVQHPCKWPRLCDFVSSSSSPVWLVLQYFSQ